MNEIPLHIQHAISNSPVFAEMTIKLNQIVQLCNHVGTLLAKEQRESLDVVRVLTTIKDDPRVFRLYADYVAEQVHAELNKRETNEFA